MPFKANQDLDARVFPRFRQFGCFYFEFSLALNGIFLSFDWLYDYTSFGFGFVTRNGNAL